MKYIYVYSFALISAFTLKFAVCYLQSAVCIWHLAVDPFWKLIRIFSLLPVLRKFHLKPGREDFKHGLHELHELGELYELDELCDSPPPRERGWRSG